MVRSPQYIRSGFRIGRLVQDESGRIIFVVYRHLPIGYLYFLARQPDGSFYEKLARIFGITETTTSPLCSSL